MDFDLPAEFGFTQHTTVDLLGVDHIALSVADPEGLAAFLCDHVGMKELARTGGWLSVGAGGRATHLALVGADGPREQGALVRMVLRVSDMRGAIAALPEGTEVEEEGPEVVTFTGPEGVVLGFTQVFGGIEYDLDHLVLRVAETEDLRVALAELGCVPISTPPQTAPPRPRPPGRPTARCWTTSRSRSDPWRPSSRRRASAASSSTSARRRTRARSCCPAPSRSASTSSRPGRAGCRRRGARSADACVTRAPCG
jgi:catechol 2,3-dioxygenase-like lactoylglutathione lyase family enzyme